MDSNAIRELLYRIDERTKNIESRQIEEIGERKRLDTRISILENWRNILTGAYGSLSIAVGALGMYARSKH